MRKFSYLSFALTFLLAGASPPRTFASETRVNAVGGLNLVLDDETADLSPFNLGNPAGLALLPSQSRFDASGALSLDTPASDAAAQVETYGTFSHIGSNFPASNLLSNSASPFTYQGLLLFPAKDRAVQLSGDLLHTTHQTDSGAYDTSADRVRGTGRMAADLDPLVLGTGIDAAQVQKSLTNLYGPGPDGQADSSLLVSTSGLLLDLPLDRSKEPSRLRIGGLFGTQIAPSQQKETITGNSGGTPVDLTVTISVPTYLNFGPDLYLMVPGSFQACLLTRVTHTELDYQLDSGSGLLIPSIAEYHLETDDSLAVFGGIKGKFPLPGSLRQKLTLNMGAYSLVGSARAKQTDPAGAEVQTTDESDVQFGLGAGLENADEFTLGFQAALDTRSGSYAPVSGTGYSLDYLAYTFGLGGEKWLNEHWALRGGLNFEDDYNGGGEDVVKVHYKVPPGTRIVATTLTMGASFKQGAFRWDLAFWMGQPSTYDSPNPNDFTTQAGVQGTLSVLFN
ncbi:MAG TPA: hypothetical protein VHE12_05145 [bacterium]|nr:hypothetical protein [bacterium]